MGANLFGQKFQFLSFGESHGVAMGAVIEGCPAGVPFDLALLEADLKRRRPGHHEDANLATSGVQNVVSPRKEKDLPEVLSGVYQGRTLGTPIAVLIRNEDARSADYSQVAITPRQGHADDVWLKKFAHADPRGGGRASGRETVSRVIAGSIAKMILRQVAPALQIRGFATRIGSHCLNAQDEREFLSKAISADQYSCRFVSACHDEVATYLRAVQAQGDSVSGAAKVVVQNMIPHLGQPVFHKLKADLGQAIFSIGAVSALEFGDQQLLSTEENAQSGLDFHAQTGAQYGGLRGGISTGEDLIFNVGFKPTSSVAEVAKKGRHDPCIVPRAIPVLEAMVACVLADHVLLARTDRI